MVPWTQERPNKVIGGRSRVFQTYETGNLLPRRRISSTR
jgi:hypothetical protein